MAKVLTGKVVSNKMQKTVVVDVETVYRHPLYQKTIFKNKRFQAHNEDMELNIGDVVRIEETRPISKNKNFKVIEKIVKK